MQHDKKKSLDDTWKTEDLKKHLKAEKHGDKYKERRPVKDDNNEKAERSHIFMDRKGERHKAPERNTFGEMEMARDHHRDKDKVKDRDRVKEKDKFYLSEKSKPFEREKMRDRKHVEEEPSKLSRQYERTDMEEEKGIKGQEMKERAEKSKQRSSDRERRHKERREKEGKRRESEDNMEQDVRPRKQEFKEEQETRHQKHRDKDTERERRHHKDNPEVEKRHRSRQEKEALDERSIRPPKEESYDSVRAPEKLKQKNHHDRRSYDENREKRHKEKRERRSLPSERRNTENEKKDYHISAPKSIQRQETDEEREPEKEEIAEQPDSADAAYDDSTNYEEDFEDYDDDFEEDSENDGEDKPETEVKADRKVVFKSAEIEEIQKAMLLENEKIASYAFQVQTAYEKETKQDQQDIPSRSSHRGTFIDFGTARKHQINHSVANKQKKRSTEILRLIDLDFSTTFSLFDLAPVKEYEMYIRNFGKTNTKQAYIQCNDDCIEREVQTEEIETEEKWTQHPGESAVVSGGHKSDSSVNVGHGTKFDSQRLTRFLHSACQVIGILLEEECADRQFDWKLMSQEPCMSISDGCFHLNTNLPFLLNRTVYLLHFSQAQRNVLLTVHGLCNDSAVPLNNKYIICVWNIWEPSTPQNILFCESQVKCCCFSPSKASLVFAGTADGSVVVWDLREDFSMHQTMQILNSKWTFRSATFSTDAIFATISHTCPVKGVEPVPSTVSKEQGMSTFSSHEDRSGLSFQIASLDESGYIIFWVVVELRKPDLAGSSSDLGLIPGGKVKLVHSSVIHLNNNYFSKDVSLLGSPQTLNIKFMPLDSSHFVVGTDIGVITHGTLNGLMQPPKQYKPLHSKMRPAKITAIDFSPFEIPAFLAGCSDGCIRLHMTSAEAPALQWTDSTDGHSITALQWSLTRPTVFFVLDSAFCIHIWDLLQNDLKPVAKEPILSDQILSMAAVGEPEKNKNLMGLALAKSSGKVEIQYINKKWAKPQPKEIEKLQMIINEIL
ncbi:cytoplasmic dynein 2 intermediate chain 1 [Bombina bombina]|uniref:cytoplasmic dynein 2 intermediate chain 1 n=1 Tax=Bombina bombina TaxID=8345 RepID=UPI00235A763A|nr:cytoplasmic dynein 2 intermediate chain 1 [Bombina bombina]